MSVIALIVASLALALSTFTFWWLNWRPGKLVIGTPPSYAGYGNSDKIILEFPFVFFNAGAKPVVVDNLRVRLPHEGGKPLIFNATVGKLGTADDRAFATQFFVGATQAVRLICEFQRKPGFVFEVRDYKVVLEARLDGDGKWQAIHTFPLRVTDSGVGTLSTSLLVHDNPI